MHFDRAYVISLEESEKRRAKFFRAAQKASLPVEWFPGIRGDQVDLEQLRAQGFIDETFQYALPGSLGCLLSHTATWDLLCDSGDEIALILEDDVLLPRNFMKRLTSISWKDIPEDWDMIWLGWHKKKLERINHVVGRPLLGVRGNSGHFCYLVRASRVEKIKKILYPTPNTSSKDVVLRKNFDKFHAYFLCKRLARTPLIEWGSVRKLINKK